MADLFHTLFKASTHHGKINDPLAQAEDEPRRHKACRALRKWLGWQLHQPPRPPAHRNRPRPQRWPVSQVGNWEQLCQNLSDLEKTKTVSSEHLPGV